MARKKVAKKSTARKKKKALDSDEEAMQATLNFIENNKKRQRSRLDDVSFDDGGGPIVRDSAAARASDRRRAVAARPPAGGRGVDRWAVAPKPRKSEDSQDFELVGVQTAEERAEANRQRAEQEGNVLEVDDDSSAVAAPPSQPGLSAAVLAERKLAWSSRFDHTEDVPPDVRRAREAYDTADYNIFVNTGRHMTAEEHASLTELDIAFARPHEASPEALDMREWARRAARSAKVVGKGEDSEVIEID